MELKLCKNCNDRPAKVGEKYCTKCRSVVLKELRAASGEGDDPLYVRTLSSRGAGMIGRKCRDTRVNFDEPRDEV